MQSPRKQKVMMILRKMGKLKKMPPREKLTLIMRPGDQKAFSVAGGHMNFKQATEHATSRNKTLGHNFTPTLSRIVHIVEDDKGNRTVLKTIYNPAKRKSHAGDMRGWKNEAERERAAMGEDEEDYSSTKASPGLTKSESLYGIPKRRKEVSDKEIERRYLKSMNKFRRKRGLK